MTDRAHDTCTSDSINPMTDGMINNDPPLKRWYLKSENHSAARRALYTARAQLG
jgi:hypothetical protein